MNDCVADGCRTGKGFMLIEHGTTAALGVAVDIGRVVPDAIVSSY